MTTDQCKAKTASGSKCTKTAGTTGFCKQHEKSIKSLVKKKQYDEVLDTIFKVCQKKGWRANLESKDSDYQLASISLSKMFDFDTVQGMLDVTVNGGVKYQIQKTSFHNYGLDSLMAAISLKLGELSWLESKDKKPEPTQQKNSQSLITILRNFDKSARQIRRRYHNRAPFIINDEYDVQDLLHSILRAFFNDVRPEEYSPSYAGSNSKVDFLLKTERIIVECKMASNSLKEKEIGNQLIIDIKRYQTHPDCEHLYCLVYDPNGEIHNPAGLENDLSGKHNKIDVKVFVIPH